MFGNIKNLHIDDLIIDETVQPRTQLNTAKIEEYAELLRSGVVFPPILVHEVNGKHYACDGFHRAAAYMAIGAELVRCDVVENSTRGQLLLDAVTYNAHHGQPLTRAERRNSVVRLAEQLAKLGEPWSQEDIAKATGFHQSTVSRVLREHYDGQEPPENPVDRAVFERAAKHVMKQRQERLAKLRGQDKLPDDATPLQIDVQEKVLATRAHIDLAVKHVAMARRYFNIGVQAEYATEIASDWEQLNGAFETLQLIRRHRPVRACPHCRATGCDACSQRGWQTEFERSRGR